MNRIPCVILCIAYSTCELVTHPIFVGAGGDGCDNSLVYCEGDARISFAFSLASTRVSADARWEVSLRLGLYKIFVYFEAVVHKPIIISFTPPTCNSHPGAVLLHGYWTVYDSPSDLLFVSYTLYNIGNNNIV